MPLIMKKTINGQPVKIRLTDGTLYSNLPIGFILPSFEDITPDGFLKMTDTLANRTVSRTEYKELFDWATARGLIGTGKPFGVGDGSTTFVIPDGKEIAFKGIGEYEGTVGAHVKSGGLANGEFLDDRVQNFSLNGNITNTGDNGYRFVYGRSDTAIISNLLTILSQDARAGDTTEVKSIGCHYYIKAKNIGVPADFISAMSEYTSYSTEEKFTGKYWIDGKPIYRKVVDCGTMPNMELKNIPNALSNIDYVISIQGSASNGSTILPLPYPTTEASNNDAIQVYISDNKTSLNFICKADLSSFLGYVTVEYTKTTDN